jgi:hypothetical protein
MRRRALPEFLGAANEMQGVLFTLMIDHSTGSIFGVEDEWDRVQDLCLFRDKVLERALRIVMTASLMLAGLAGAGQEIIWITDRDEIVATPEHADRLLTLFAGFNGSLLKSQPRSVRLGTTESDTGDLMLEDVTAIPDLVAGMLGDIVSGYRQTGIMEMPNASLGVPSKTREKSKMILNWHSYDRARLRRLNYLVMRDSASKKLAIKKMRIPCGKMLVPSRGPLWYPMNLNAQA